MSAKSKRVRQHTEERRRAWVAEGYERGEHDEEGT